jgi:hypothetical protein
MLMRKRYQLSLGHLPTLAPVRRRDGARSTIVMLAFGNALRRQNAKTLPAIPEPEMRILGEDILGDLMRSKQ